MSGTLHLVISIYLVFQLVASLVSTQQTVRALVTERTDLSLFKGNKLEINLRDFFVLPEDKETIIYSVTGANKESSASRVSTFKNPSVKFTTTAPLIQDVGFVQRLGADEVVLMDTAYKRLQHIRVPAINSASKATVTDLTTLGENVEGRCSDVWADEILPVVYVLCTIKTDETNSELRVYYYRELSQQPTQVTIGTWPTASLKEFPKIHGLTFTDGDKSSGFLLIDYRLRTTNAGVPEDDKEILRYCIRSLNSPLESFSLDCASKNVKEFTTDLRASIIAPRDISVQGSRLFLIGFLQNSANLAAQYCQTSKSGDTDFTFACTKPTQQFSNSKVLVQPGAFGKLLVVDPTSKKVSYCTAVLTPEQDVEKLLASNKCTGYSISILNLEDGKTQIRSLHSCPMGWSLALQVKTAEPASPWTPAIVSLDLQTGIQYHDTVNFETAYRQGHYFLKYKSENNAIYVRRPSKPTWLLDETACGESASFCELTIKADGDKNQAQVTFSLTILDTKQAPARIVSKSPSDYDLLYFSNQHLQIQSRDFVGDDLSFEVKLGGEIEKAATVSVYHSNRLKLEIGAPDKVKLADAIVGEDFLVGQYLEVNNQIGFFECFNTELDTRVCRLKSKGVLSSFESESLQGLTWAQRLTDNTFGVILKSQNQASTLLHVKLEGETFSSKVIKLPVAPIQVTGGNFVNSNTNTGVSIIFAAVETSIMIYRDSEAKGMALWTELQATNFGSNKKGFIPVSISLIADWKNASRTLLAVTHRYQERADSTAKTVVTIVDFMDDMRIVSQVDLPVSDVEISQTCVLEKNPVVTNQTPKLLAFGKQTGQSLNKLWIISPWDATLSTQVLFNEADSNAALFCGDSSQADMFNLLVTKDGKTEIRNFYRDASGRAIKSVHSIVKDVPAKTRSHPLHSSQTIHVAIKEDGTWDAWISHSDGPLIFADLNGQPSNFATLQTGTDKTLSGPITVTASNSLNTSTWTGSAVLNYQNYGLRIVKNTSAATVGKLSGGNSYNLEDFVKIQGPTASVGLENNSNPNISLFSRLALLSTYAPKKPAQKIFLYSHVQFSQRTLFAAGFYSDGTQNLMIVHVFEEEGVEEVIEIPVVGKPLLFKSIALNLVENRYIFFGLYPADLTTRAYELKYTLVEKGKVIASGAAITDYFIEKLEIVPEASQKAGEYTFHVLRSDGKDTSLDTLTIFTNNNPAKLTQVRTLQNISDFSLAQISERWMVIGYGVQSAGYSVYSFNPGSFATLLDSKVIMPNKNYLKVSIDCKGYNNTSAVCAINTRSSYLVEMYVRAADLGVSWYYPLKYLNYEVTNLRIDDDYLIGMAVSSVAAGGERTRSLMVWKSAENIGSSKLFAQANLTNTKVAMIPLDYSIAFDIVRFDKADTLACLVAVATLDGSAPLKRFRAGNMKLVFGGTPSSEYSVTGVQLVAEGFFKKSFALTDVLFNNFTPKNPDDSAFHPGFWWVMVVGFSLITIIVLIVVTVMYCRKAPPMGLNDSVIYMDAELDDSNTMDTTNVLAGMNGEDTRQLLDRRN